MASSLENMLGGLLGGSGSQGGGALGGLGGLLGNRGGAMAAGGIVGALMPTITGMLANGGLQKLMGGMQSAGLEDKAKSWLGSGSNQPISADEVKQVVDPAHIQQVAEQAGVSHDEAAHLIAQALPAAVDHVTPDGATDAAAVDQHLAKAS
jgi:uncharacterized protein YidB (DUF937 family)